MLFGTDGVPLCHGAPSWLPGSTWQCISAGTLQPVLEMGMGHGDFEPRSRSLLLELQLRHGREVIQHI